MDLTAWVACGIGVAGFGFSIIDRIVTRAKRETTWADQAEHLKNEIGALKSMVEGLTQADSKGREGRGRSEERLKAVEKAAEAAWKLRDEFIEFRASNQKEHEGVKREVERLGRRFEEVLASLKNVATGSADRLVQVPAFDSSKP